MRHIIYFITIILVGQGCLIPDPLDVDIPAHQPKMTISSVIVPNQIMIVTLGWSYSPLENKGQDSSTLNPSLLVEHALVTVHYDGKTDTLFKIAPGIYTSLNTLQISQTFYHLYAKDSISGQEIHATTQLMSPVAFDSILPKVKRSPDTSVSIRYRFKDLAGRGQYYMVNYGLTQTSSVWSGLGNFNNLLQSTLKEIDLYSDLSLGKDQEDIIHERALPVQGSDTLLVQVVHISKAFYEFMAAYQKSGKFFNQLTGQPISYPSNVMGGYGFFSAVYPDRRIFDLNKY